MFTFSIVNLSLALAAVTTAVDASGIHRFLDGNQKMSDMKKNLLSINVRSERGAAPTGNNGTDKAVAFKEMVTRLPGHGRRHVRRDLSTRMSFQEFCSSSIGPYISAGYDCQCDSVDGFVLCDQASDEDFQYIFLTYDSMTATRGAGIHCVCDAENCATTGNVCITVAEDTSGRPFCVFSDIMVDNSECGACQVCPITGSVYEVNVDSCLSLPVGSEGLGCLLTDLLIPTVPATPEPTSPPVATTSAPVTTTTQPPVGTPDASTPPPGTAPPNSFSPVFLPQPLPSSSAGSLSAKMATVAFGALSVAVMILL
jgi:hypothetical protein